MGTIDISGILHIANILHIVGTILGFGGAITAAIIMLRLRTDEQRLHRGLIARRISWVTWVGYGLLVVSGIVLTLNFEFQYTVLFSVKHLLTAVLLVDALFIHFRYFPCYLWMHCLSIFVTSRATSGSSERLSSARLTLPCVISVLYP